MNRPALHFVFAMLTIVTGSVAMAQPQAQPGGQPAEAGGAPAEAGGQPLAQATEAPTAEGVWRDARLLHVPSRLSLTLEQAQQILPILEQLQSQLQAAQTDREQVWQQDSGTLTAVLDKWIAGQEAEATQMARADQVSTWATRQSRAMRGAVMTAAESIYGLLTEDQQFLIETVEQAEVRQQMQARFDGAPTFADYLANQMQAHRELMPDEYGLLRSLEAARAAQKALDPRDPDYSDFESAILDLFDRVSAMPDLQFETELPDLAENAAEFLGIGGPGVAEQIQRDRFIDWLTDSRTPKYLKLYGTTAKALAPDQPRGKGQLLLALDKARLITTVGDLGLDVEQCEQLRMLARSARVDLASSGKVKADLLTNALPSLTQIIPYMLTGQPLTGQWERFLQGLAAELQKQDALLDGALVPRVSEVRQVMFPEQARFVDWRVPPVVRGALDAQARGERMREQAELVLDAMDLLEGMRTIDFMTLLQVRVVRTSEFLEQYMDPRGPEFTQARDEIMALVQEAYGIKQQEWDSVGPSIAAGVLASAGQLSDEQWQPSDRPLDWYAIRDMLLAPETEGLLQQIVKARGG